MFKSHAEAVAHMRQCSTEMLIRCFQPNRASARAASFPALRRVHLTSAWAIRAVLLERAEYPL